GLGVVVSAGQGFERLDCPQVGEQIEFFTQTHIRASEARPDRSGYWAFKGYLVSFDGIDQILRKRIAKSGKGFRANNKGFPLGFEPGGSEHGNSRTRDFRAYSVARYESDLMLHLGRLLMDKTINLNTSV